MTTPNALRFFHGTSSTLLDAITTGGLQPQTNPTSSMRGNQSTIPGFTEKAIFLAPSMEEAAYYAASQAEHCNGEPIILEVFLLSDDRLAVSDDYIAMQAIAAMLKTAKLPELEFDDEGDIHEYGTSSEAYYLWRELFSSCIRDLLAGKSFDLDRIANLTRNADIRQEIEDIGHGQLAPEIWNAASEASKTALVSSWRNSIATDRDPSVAHFGPIPPAQVQLVPDKLTRKALNNRSRGLGLPATWQLESTFPADQKPAGRKMRA